MELVRPDVTYKDSYIAAAHEFAVEQSASDYDPVDLRELEDFGAFVDKRLSMANGKNLKPGYVPQTDFWLVDGKEYIGWVGIRHLLTDHLRQIGGHIGYKIRPSKRNKGYGSVILQLALPKVKDLGIGEVLLTCDETNIASRKIIEKNGGVLENKAPNPQGGPDKLRFWINVR